MSSKIYFFFSFTLLFTFASTGHSARLAADGSSIALFDLFNLTDNPHYNAWEKTLGRGLRRSLHAYVTAHQENIEIIPFPRIHTALIELRVETHYISPEQVKPIAERLQADLVILGAFNVVEGVVATSLKVVDGKSGRVLFEDTRFGRESDIEEYLNELQSDLTKKIFGGDDPPPSQPPSASSRGDGVSAQVPVDIPEQVGIVPPSPKTIEPQVSTDPRPPAAAPPIPERGTAGSETARTNIESPDAPLVEGFEPESPQTPVSSDPLQGALDRSWRRAHERPQVEPQSGRPSLYSQAPSPPSGPPVYPPPPVQQPPQQMASPFPPTIQNAPYPPAFPPRRPIESEIPPLPQQAGRAPQTVPSPFQPMPVRPAPPPSPEQLGYPLVPPGGPAFGASPQQPPYPGAQEQPGRIRRFFGWLGRTIGITRDQPSQAPIAYPPGSSPSQPPPVIVPQQPQQAAPRQQPEGRRFLWIRDRQQSDAGKSNPPMLNSPPPLAPEPVLVAGLQPNSPFSAPSSDAMGRLPNLAPKIHPVTEQRTPPSSPADSLQDMASLGERYFQNGYFELAEDTYRKATLMDRDQPDLHFNLAQACLAQGKEKEAVDALEKVIELRPHDRESLDRLGMLYAKEKEWGKAVDAFTQLVKEQPGNSQTFLKLGLAFDQMGNPRQAVRSYKKALSLEPENAEAARNMASVYLKLGEKAKAQEFLRLARQIDPGVGDGRRLEAVAKLPGPSKDPVRGTLFTEVR